MKKVSTLFIISLTIFACSTDPDSQDTIYNVEGVALNGYDPVAYFEQGEAQEGTEIESLEYGGLVYFFSSTKNKFLFQENPSKYLPKYGGWCAYAVAETSTKMEPDPSQWQLQDGELILFTSNLMTKLTGDLKDDWNEEPEVYESKADANWQEMTK